MTIPDERIKEVFEVALKLKRIDHAEEGRRLFAAVAESLETAFPEDFKIGVSLFGPVTKSSGGGVVSGLFQPDHDVEGQGAIPSWQPPDHPRASTAGPSPERSGLDAPHGGVPELSAVRSHEPPKESFTIEEDPFDLEVHPVRLDDVDMEAWTRYNMGITYIRMGMTREAVAELRQAVKKGGEPGEAATRALGTIASRDDSVEDDPGDSSKE